MEYNEEKIYYVYEWYDLNTNDVIYVGQGKGIRYKQKSRNIKFMEYIKNHDCHYRIISDGLTELESIKLESERVRYYKSIGQCSCVLTADGYRSMPKETNPNYGNGDALKRTFELRPELKEQTKRVGTDNGRARRCSLEFPTGEVIEFEIIKDMCQYLIDNNYSNSTLPHLQSAVAVRIKQGKSYLGFIFKYLD